MTPEGLLAKQSGFRDAEMLLWEQSKKQAP